MGTFSVNVQEQAENANLKPDVDSEVESDSEVEPGSEVDSEVESGSEVDNEVESGSEVDNEVESGSEVDNEVESGSEVDNEVEGGESGDGLPDKDEFDGEDEGEEKEDEDEETESSHGDESEENMSDKENESDANESEGRGKEEEGNVGWADAMSKVLCMGKNSDKPVSVLSKAKKDNVGKVKKDKDETKEKSSDSEGETEPAKPHVPISVRRSKKRELDSVCRVKPDITKRAAEKVLTKIATRGVVQLFNAVREQQKHVKTQLKEAGNSRKREKILKNLDKDTFLAVLDGRRPTAAGGPVSKRPKLEPKEEDEDNSTWSALREDFMLGAKMKDWDKEEEEDNE